MKYPIPLPDAAHFAQQSLHEFIEWKGPWQFTATWTYNRPMSLQVAKATLRKFDAMLKRRLFGKCFLDKPSVERVTFVATSA